jgi:hypothetical protein
MGHNLNALSKNLQVPLLDIANETGQLDSMVPFTQAQANSTEFGIILRVDERSNILSKILSLIWVAYRVRSIGLKLQRQGCMVVGSMGVYPDMSDPVTIYELDSEAEQYINRYVLPAFPEGIKGHLRKLIMKLTRLHPSIAGVVILAKKT